MDDGGLRCRSRQRLRLDSIPAPARLRRQQMIGDLQGDRRALRIPCCEAEQVERTSLRVAQHAWLIGDPDSAGTIPWRPWLVGEIRANRLAAPFLSSTTARDLSMTVWVVGGPLLLVAASLRRQYGDEIRIALYYSLPAILFTIVRWPVQGLGMGMDLVVAAFPALYGAAWVCAHDSTRTRIAATLLVSAHLAFWVIVLDPQFVNQVID